MTDILINKTIPELREIARKSGIKGHSKYTRKNNLQHFLSETLKLQKSKQTTLKPQKEKKSRQTTLKARLNKTKKNIEIDSDGDDEGQCELDGRLIACAENNKREKLLFECFKGVAVTNQALAKSFACDPSKIKNMVGQLISTYPNLRATIHQIGGRNKNYDYTFQHEGRYINIELKTNTKATQYEKLIKVPWYGYGQLIQLFLNVKNDIYNDLLKSFDTEGMIRHWYNTIIKDEIIPKYNIKGDVSYDDYYTLLFKSSAGAAKHYEDASLSIGVRNLFRYFHAHKTKADNKYRADLWKKFLKSWMESHRFSESSVLKLIQGTLEKKHIWICTTKNDAYIIEGPTCTSLKYKGLKAGASTTVQVYTANFETPKTRRMYTVDIHFRIYWKNGGQGVHNLCLKIE